MDIITLIKPFIRLICSCNGCRVTTLMRPFFLDDSDPLESFLECHVLTWQDWCHD
jgi:hypothetical protein